MKEIIFGFDCVQAALSANRRQIYKLLIYKKEDPSSLTSRSNSVSKSCGQDQIIELAMKRKIPVQFTTRKELDILLDNRPHQNLALEVSKFEPPVLASPPVSALSPEIFLFPVNILDPQNLGSIIRSAAFYGCAGLITCLSNSCDFTPIVSKASAGSMEVFDGLFRTKSPINFIKNAKVAGYKIYGTFPSTQTQPSTREDKIILLLGNEGAGLNKEILSLCDSNLSISPQNNTCPNLDSLNVGVATGILLDRLHNR